MAEATHLTKRPRLFLSWSGKRSREFALALRAWLPKVLGVLDEPFMSESDIEPGTPSLQFLDSVLLSTNFGIVCLTPEIVERPWLNFEAGAIYRATTAARNGEARVYVCLLGMKPKDVPIPLGKFQSVEAQHEVSMLALVQSIRRHLAPEIAEGNVRNLFPDVFPGFREKIKEIAGMEPDDPAAVRRLEEGQVQSAALERLAQASRAKAWLDVLNRHHSDEWRVRRAVIRGAFSEFMASSGPAQPLSECKDKAELFKEVELLLNYYEGLGSLHRFGFFGEELLDLAHNSLTSLWSALTQTAENEPMRFDLQHVERCFDCLRPRHRRGFDYASDVMYFAKQVLEYRAAKGMLKKATQFGTGGMENPQRGA